MTRRSSESVRDELTPAMDATMMARGMRRLVATSLLLLLLFGSLKGISNCAGWQGSAAARMACCLKAHDDCPPSQSAADACCARTEQATQGVRVVAANPDDGTPAMAATASLFGLIPADDDRHAHSMIATRSDRPPGSSPPARHSILRI